MERKFSDALYVRISKDMTVDQMWVKLPMLRERYQEASTLGEWNDRWAFHPLPTMAEPEKPSCLLRSGEFVLSRCAGRARFAVIQHHAVLTVS